MDDGQGKRRRLPPWMLAATAADRVSECGEEHIHVNVNVKEGIVSQSVQPNPKCRARGEQIKKAIPLSKQRETAEEKTCSVKKCMTRKQKRRRLNQEEDAGNDDEACEPVVQKKRCSRIGEKFQDFVPQNRRRVNRLSKSKSSEEIEISSPGEDDGELTVEDLMSIAQEYVRTDEHMEQPRLPLREEELEKRVADTALSANGSAGLPDAPQSNERSPKDKEVMSVLNSSEPLASGAIEANLNRTGDPAQDMLDLFLGPLLKKPPAEENKFEIFKAEMTFAFQSKKQRENNTTTEEVVPLTKKKSSLRDKVSMFLD
ncbi:uncharacterized protein LOC127809423 [Diospyros lotus]|uniref:uncharacterized protein LOC127809423 n=1 Tax=Diospyros lotus TaxID=55363 RepID=UPI00225074C8|nr:uncharacterized protein LOC127809423 [Diospyros lotus]XP_052204147.1 uncharacterized protein LOC127809423 [Diospyros lotus]